MHAPSLSGLAVLTLIGIHGALPVASAKFEPKAEGELGGPCKAQFVREPDPNPWLMRFCNPNLGLECVGVDDKKGFCASGYNQDTKTKASCASLSEEGAEHPLLPGFWKASTKPLEPPAYQACEADQYCVNDPTSGVKCEIIPEANKEDRAAYASITAHAWTAAATPTVSKDRKNRAKK